MSVPHYEGPSVDDILAYLQNHEVFWRYVPELHKEVIKLPKQWVVNIAWTVVGKPFGEWVRERIEERNYKVAVEKNLLIQMDPEVAETFKKSTAVSSKC